MFDSLWPHGLQHTRLPCPSLSPGVCSDSYPLSQWCYLAISSSAAPLFFLQSFPSQGLFQGISSFASGGQSIEISASVLPMSIQGWFPLGLTGLISFKSKGFSRVFSNTTIWKSQFFNAQPEKWHAKTDLHFYDITSPQETIICLVFSVLNNGITQLPRPKILTSSVLFLWVPVSHRIGAP